MARVTTEQLIENSYIQVIAMVKEGFTDKQIAEKLGISRGTYVRHKKSNPKLRQVYEELIDDRNQIVEEKLYNNCTGYHYEEEVATKIKEEYEGSEGQVLVKESVKISKVKKYCKPDLNAQRYWLNNKKKESWKDDPHKVNNDRKLTKLKEKEVNGKVIDF